jgi:hypothetical protein
MNYQNIQFVEESRQYYLSFSHTTYVSKKTERHEYFFDTLEEAIEYRNSKFKELGKKDPVDGKDTKIGDKVPGHVYLMKVMINNRFLGKVKIGLSKNLSRRVGQLNNCTPKHISFEIAYVKATKDMLKLEQELHSKFDHLRYTPKIEFEGSSEIFIFDESIKKSLNLIFQY